MILDDLTFATRGSLLKPARTPGKKVRMRRNGRTISSEPLQAGNVAPLHLPDTLLAAASRRTLDGAGEFTIKPADLRQAIRSVPQHRLIVFVVDASDSMGEGTTTARIAVAKGAVMALLKTAYVNRDRVCMVIFQDGQARTVLPPTTSIDLARKQLRSLPIGGSTPLARGLMESWRIIKQERQADPSCKPLLVLVSDGEANAPIGKSNRPDEEVLELSQKIAADGVPAIIIETGSAQSNRLMQQIADTFRTTCYRSSELRVARLVELVEKSE